MSENTKHVTYEDAGVDTAEGGRAVDAIKQMVKETNRPEVIGGIGGFGGLFSAADGGPRPCCHVRKRHSRFWRRAAVLP